MDISLNESIDEHSSLQKRKCSIENVYGDEKLKGQPLLVSFSNGKLLDGKSLKGTLFHNVTTNKRHSSHKVFLVDTPKMSYVGKNYGVENYSSLKESIYIGVLDRGTGKMKLVETSSFMLQPVLKDVKSTNFQLKKSIHSLTFEEKQQRMINSFGTKKAKQMISRIQQSKVNTEEMASAMDQAGSSIHVAAEEIENEEKEKKDTYTFVLPECDRSARTIEEVYSLEKILPDSILIHMKKSAKQQLQEENEENPEEKSLLFRELMTVVKMEPDADNQLRMACTVLYIEYLLQFLRLKQSDLSGNILTECSKKIRFHILDNYTKLVERRKIRNRECEDRAFCCAMVLAFIVNKYELSINVLLQSLPLRRERMDTLMKVIGARPLRDISLYSLRLPLAGLPKEYTKIKKGKK